MKINKKVKVIIPILLIFIILMILIGVLIYKKIENSYVFKIKEAFVKTLNASSTEFEFEYIENNEKIEALGNIEYSYENLILLGNATSNKGEVVINVEKGNSDVGYFLEKFNYWITFDVTSIADKVLSVLEGFEEGDIKENFPVQSILKFFKFDDKINITKYPNKLSNEFLLKFISKDFNKNVLKYKEEKDIVKYIVKPNVYEFLKEFVESSKITNKEKKELLKDLENNKDKLNKINLELSVSIDENGYIKEILYYQDDNGYITSMKIVLNNINNAKVEIIDEVLNKLKEE